MRGLEVNASVELCSEAKRALEHTELSLQNGTYGNSEGVPFLRNDS